MKDSVETTVRDAASYLGLSERQVRNYIKSRSIKAIKVGREWFVDTASVVAFSNRYHNLTQDRPNDSISADQQTSRPA